MSIIPPLKTKSFGGMITVIGSKIEKVVSVYPDGIDCLSRYQIKGIYG